MLAGYTGPTMEPSTTSATAFAPEGALMEYLHPDYGVQIYRMLRNHSGSDFVLGIAVDFETDSQVDVEVAANDAPKNTVGGITQNTVPAGHYFWGLVRGKGQVLLNNDVGIGTVLGVTGGAGMLDDTGLTNIGAVPPPSTVWLARALQVNTLGAAKIILAEVFVFGS
jgi:hypothetical protein|tara:strand:- start:2437 stop:2937 length:501 start_codon:yes stop_codon:yes gene_type:complete